MKTNVPFGTVKVGEFFIHSNTIYIKTALIGCSCGEHNAITQEYTAVQWFGNDIPVDVPTGKELRDIRTVSLRAPFPTIKELSVGTKFILFIGEGLKCDSRIIRKKVGEYDDEYSLYRFDDSDKECENRRLKNTAKVKVVK